MYLTLLVPIFAGIINSIFCKSKILNGLKIPMDFGKNFVDGKRIFGDHKTIKGFIGYIIFNIIFSILFGFLFQVFNGNSNNFFYMNHENTILYNIWIGFLIGLFYALFELPNSFLKRRLDITPGKSTKGLSKIFFVFLDQADSVFGVALVVWMFYPIGWKVYLLYILIGVGTHILINMLLYFLHLRKNMF
jgi:hypothetical protein